MTPRALDQDLGEFDTEVAVALHSELGRQRDTLEMIASENFAPLTTLGFGAEDFLEVADALKPDPVEDKPRARVAALTERHPLYATLRSFGARS
ncbi:MAG: hypothetical protein J2P20_00170 [Pseudonocardia sp.]|nr:hypothetical protein [Pseudonocardia sp.]MBO0876814.1 hypothetical protein [Pseudonocardia sp.]